MKTNHTLGPWVVKNSGESNYFTIADSKANWLMQIQHNGEQYAAIQDANARLIAAAPELLACLQYIEGRLPAHDTKSISQARAAIAKATGQ